MGWLLIPGMMLGFVLFGAALRQIGGRQSRYSGESESILESIGAFVFLGAVLLLAFSIVMCPALYLNNLNTLEGLMAYYDMVEPHIVDTQEEHVTVGGLELGLWQAGAMNLAMYNQTLRQMRYRDGIPIFGSLVPTPPEELKYIRVRAGSSGGTLGGYF